MIKEISKKLTMKKTFFVTQLESFFNTISQEYQELINAKEIENSILQEKVNKLELDVKNLVEIRRKLEKSEQIYKKQIESMQAQTVTLRKSNSNIDQSIGLKNKIEAKDDTQELEKLKAKIKQLQGFISKGATAYSDNLANQKSEELIQEISQSLKK